MPTEVDMSDHCQDSGHVLHATPGTRPCPRAALELRTIEPYVLLRHEAQARLRN